MNELILIKQKESIILFFINKIKIINKYLVDPASSHMLVLKIKPCMPKFRWMKKNRDCGWLNKSVLISLVNLFLILKMNVEIKG